MIKLHIPRASTYVTHLDCYWVGSLDFDFLVEINLGFPLNPQKVKNCLQEGRGSNQDTAWRTRRALPRQAAQAAALASGDAAAEVAMAASVSRRVSRAWPPLGS